MLSHDKFAEEFTQWCERWRQEINVGVSRKYYTYLKSKGIDDDQLLAASDLLVATSRHFPTAEEIVAACPPKERYPSLSKPKKEPEPETFTCACGTTFAVIVTDATTKQKCFRCHLKDNGVIGRDADRYERAVTGRATGGGDE